IGRPLDKQKRKSSPERLFSCSRVFLFSCIVGGHEMADENKRDTERVPVPSPLYGEVKVFQPMTILDVSKGGAQIETPFALQLDSLHDFRLSLGERSIIVKGRIAHCH